MACMNVYKWYEMCIASISYKITPLECYVSSTKNYNNNK